jgi:hypothetical protein
MTRGRAGITRRRVKTPRGDSGNLHNRVNAPLPDMVPDLYCPRCPRDLRARRVPRQRRTCVERRRPGPPGVRVQILGNHPEVGEETPDRSNTFWLRLRTRARSRRWSCVTFGWGTDMADKVHISREVPGPATAPLGTVLPGRRCPAARRPCLPGTAPSYEPAGARAALPRG